MTEDVDLLPLLTLLNFCSVNRQRISQPSETLTTRGRTLNLAEALEGFNDAFPLAQGTFSEFTEPPRRC
jgi:hypothetical protein